MANVLRAECKAIIQSTGVALALEDGVGSKLLNGIQYIYHFDSADGPTVGVHVKWDASVIFTCKIEEGCLPRFFSNSGSSGTVDVSDNSIAKGDWIVWPMPAAQVSVISDDATTGAGTYAAATGVLTVAGGTAGGAVFHLPDQSTSRLRLSLTTGGTGGVVRVGAHRKS
jgi:hypothetical protein